jgi:hypothetical protein
MRKRAAVYGMTWEAVEIRQHNGFWSLELGSWLRQRMIAPNFGFHNSEMKLKLKLELESKVRKQETVTINVSQMKVLMWR